MTDETFAAKKKELEEKYPVMFSFPGVQEGEVWIGNQMCEVVGHTIPTYRAEGMPSVRAGNEPVTGKMRINGKLEELDWFRPIFVNLREYLEAIEAHEAVSS